MFSFYFQYQDAFRMAVWEKEDPGGNVKTESKSFKQSHEGLRQGKSKDGTTGKESYCWY